MSRHCSRCGHDSTEDALFCPRCGNSLKSGSEDPLVGKVIADRYLLLEKIGEGRSGVIYRGEHTALGRRVAVKILHDQLSRDEGAIDRFRREATTVTEIDNDHILQVSDFGRAPDGRLFFAMEFLEGEALSKTLEREGKLPVKRAVDIVTQVGEALMEAHGQGYVHRDLRPRNVFLTTKRGRQDFVKLLDFGLSRLSATDAEPTLTAVGMGDPRYISPEQALGLAVDRRADLYSMGVIAWEMVVGRAPYAGSTTAELVDSHVNAPIPSVRELRPDCPVWLDQVIRTAMAKSADRRFLTVLRMIECLKGEKGPGEFDIKSLEQPLRQKAAPAPATEKKPDSRAATDAKPDPAAGKPAEAKGEPTKATSESAPPKTEAKTEAKTETAPATAAKVEEKKVEEKKVEEKKVEVAKADATPAATAEPPKAEEKKAPVAAEQKTGEAAKGAGERKAEPVAAKPEDKAAGDKPEGAKTILDLNPAGRTLTPGSLPPVAFAAGARDPSKTIAPGGAVPIAPANPQANGTADGGSDKLDPSRKSKKQLKAEKREEQRRRSGQMPVAKPEGGIEVKPDEKPKAAKDAALKDPAIEAWKITGKADAGPKVEGPAKGAAGAATTAPEGAAKSAPATKADAAAKVEAKVEVAPEPEVKAAAATAVMKRATKAATPASVVGVGKKSTESGDHDHWFDGDARVEEEFESSGPRKNIGLIAGLAAGGVAVAALLVISMFGKTPAKQEPQQKRSYDTPAVSAALEGQKKAEAAGSPAPAPSAPSVPTTGEAPSPPVPAAVVQTPPPGATPAVDPAKAAAEEAQRVAAQQEAAKKAEAMAAVEKAAEEKRLAAEAKEAEKRAAEEKAAGEKRSAAEIKLAAKKAAEEKAAADARAVAERKAAAKQAAEQKAADDAKAMAERKAAAKQAAEQKAADQARLAAERKRTAQEKDLAQRATLERRKLEQSAARQNARGDAPRDPLATSKGPGGQAEDYIKFGRQKLNAGDISGAQAQFSRAREIEPQNPQAISGIGECEFEQGDYTGAAVHLKQAARLSARNAHIAVLLGQAYFKLGRCKESLVEYRRALRLDSRNEEAAQSLDVAERKCGGE